MNKRLSTRILSALLLLLAFLPIQAYSQSTFYDRFTGSVLAPGVKQPADAATTAAITLSGHQTIDGVALTDFMRCLVKNQVDQTKNGVYVVQAGPWYRALDFNGPSGTVQGQLINVTGGNSQTGLWQITTANPVQIDQSGGQTTSPSNITFTLPTFTSGFPTATAATLGIANFPTTGGLSISAGAVTVHTDASTLTNTGGTLSCTTATSSQIGCAKFGTGLGITTGNVTLANPSASTLGGIESYAAVTHQWINSISTSGVPASAQPVCADISDAGTVCTTSTGTSGATVPLLNGNLTFSGTHAVTTTSLPAQASGLLGLSGTTSAPSLAASAEGDVFLTTTDGLNLIGEGSTNDFNLLNKNGGSACVVATATTTLNCGGLKVGGAPVATTTNIGTLTTVNHAASPYTILSTDVLLAIDTTGGSVTVTLPTPQAGRIIRFKDIKGNFGTTAPAVAQHTSEKIEGVAGSLKLSANWGNYALESDGTDWFKISAANNLANVTYGTSGGTFTPPGGVTEVHVCGRGGSGGGGGGGAGGGGSTAAAADGGGGAGPGGSTYTACKDVAVTPNTGYTATVGSKGTAGNAGSVTAANASGSTGGDGTNGGAGGNTSLGSLFFVPGGYGGGLGTGGQLASPGIGGFVGEGVYYGTAGANGGAPNSTGGLVNQQYIFSPWAADVVQAAASAAGGASGGGGGGNGGMPAPGDSAPPAAVTAGAGGANTANGGAATACNASTNGVGGEGGGGGGGGGVKAATGSTGGTPAAGCIGTDGFLSITWQE